jgi:hypothetical protein
MTDFHALLVVRDEVDIIERSLDHFSSWADAVYVFDTGSVDGTWQVIQSVAAETPAVHAVDREPVWFSLPKVRSYLFHRVRGNFEDGDWFLRVDADERHHVSPRDFVKHHMSSREMTAWRQYYDFRLTEDELSGWKAERAQPIEDRRRYFTIEKGWSEPRLFQYRPTMKWPAHASFPLKTGIAARKRLPIRHYPHRDPVQMAKRYALRSIQVRNKDGETDKTLDHHWAREDWRTDVVRSEHEDLQYWEFGQELPTVERGAVRSAPTRLLQHVFYRLPRSLIDYWGRTYDESESPDRLPDHLQDRIEDRYQKIYSEFGASGFRRSERAF